MSSSASLSGKAPTSRYVEAFLEMMAAERGAARNTLDAYRRDLDCFLAHAGEIGRDALTADSDTLRSFIRAQAKAGVSPRTAARRLSALRQFFQFLFVEGIRSDDPSLAIDRPKQRRRLPNYLSEQEVDRLLAA